MYGTRHPEQGAGAVDEQATRLGTESIEVHIVVVLTSENGCARLNTAKDPQTAPYGGRGSTDIRTVGSLRLDQAKRFDS